MNDMNGYMMPALAVILLYCGVCMLIGKKKKEPLSVRTMMLKILFGMYLAALFSITVSPMYGFSTKLHFESVNIVPFMAWKDRAVNPLNLWGNIILFLPMGAIPVLLSNQWYKLRRTVGLGFCISVLIEGLQLFLTRGTDIDDVILNTMGTLIGAVAAKLVVKGSRRLRKQIGRGNRGGVCFYCLLLLATVLITGGVKRQQFSSSGSQSENRNRTIQAQPAKAASLTECLEAQKVCVLNAETNTVLYDKNKDSKVAPASTAKMVTALVVLHYNSVKDVVKAGEELGKVAKDASRAGIFKGDELSVENLLYGLLLPSGNDAAYVLAAYTGRKIAGEEGISTEKAIALFVEKMNETANKLGATDTRFMRPDGYDADGQYTTANDLALIAGEFIRNNKLAEIVKTPEWKCVYEDGRTATYKNTNQLIDDKSEYYDPAVIGIKTGSSKKAGKCLVSGAEIKGNLYVCVVMGDSEDGRFLDSLTVYRKLENVVK